jgi:hypothetical protein
LQRITRGICSVADFSTILSSHNCGKLKKYQACFCLRIPNAVSFIC